MLDIVKSGQATSIRFRSFLAGPARSRRSIAIQSCCRWSAVILTAIVLPAEASAQSAGVLLRPVAVSGELAPDGDGFFASFQQPSINTFGDVAFSATFTNTINIAGILVDQPVGLELVARTNDPAPDGNGALFTFGVGPIPINSSGTVAFSSALFGTSGGFSDTPRLLTAAGQTLRQVVRRGQAPPDGNGTFDTFEAIGLDDAGEASFYATFVGTTGGFGSDDLGVYRGAGIADIGLAPLDEIVRRGEVLGTSNLVVSNFTPLLVTSSRTGGVGIAAAVANSSNPPADAGVLLVDNGMVRSIRAMLDDPSPDGDGTLFDFGVPYLARDGNVAMNVIFDNATLGLANNMGIVSFDAVFLDRVLVREGDDVPGLNAETFAVDFAGAAGFASTDTAPNRFVFRGRISNPVGGPTADDGLFLARNGEILEVVREGDPAPAGSITDGEFDFLALDQAHVNENGHVAFFAHIRNGSLRGDGIFRWIPGGSLVDSIARVGQPLLGSTIQQIFFMDSLETRRAGVSAMNGQGEITFRVRLDDGREAIIATNGVPEPAGGLVLGLLVLGMLGSQRDRSRRAGLVHSPRASTGECA